MWQMFSHLIDNKMNHEYEQNRSLVCMRCGLAAMPLSTMVLMTKLDRNKFELWNWHSHFYAFGKSASLFRPRPRI